MKNPRCLRVSVREIALLKRLQCCKIFLVRECLHLDVGVCVPAEMPEAALVVRKHRIGRRIVQIQNFLTGIALVVLGDEIRQRAGNRRGLALGQNTNAGIYRLLRLDQALLRVQLVVERHDLNCLPRAPPLAFSSFARN